MIFDDLWELGGNKYFKQITVPRMLQLSVIIFMGRELIPLRVRCQSTSFDDLLGLRGCKNVTSMIMYKILGDEKNGKSTYLASVAMLV